MFDIHISQDVLDSREELQRGIEKLRSEGSTDEQLALYAENGSFGAWGSPIMMLFNSTDEVARFIGVPSSCFKAFFMS